MSSGDSIGWGRFNAAKVELEIASKVGWQGRLLLSILAVKGWGRFKCCKSCRSISWNEISPPHLILGNWPTTLCSIGNWPTRVQLCANGIGNWPTAFCKWDFTPNLILGNWPTTFCSIWFYATLYQVSTMHSLCLGKQKSAPRSSSGIGARPQGVDLRTILTYTFSNKNKFQSPVIFTTLSHKTKDVWECAGVALTRV